MKAKIKSLIVRIPLVQKFLKKRSENRIYELLKSKPPVFIYQMGKVASSSINESVYQQYSGVCIHGHSFSEDNESFLVRALYKTRRTDNIPLKIISLVREPVSRNISAFFQNFERDTGFKYENNPYTTVELLNVFLEKYRHDVPLVWFDNNIKLHFGIDVYASPFPERGYDIFKNGNVELLLLKHDVKDDIKEKIVSDFVGIKDFKLINANIGTDKEYASTYDEFKMHSLPEEYLDRLLHSKYANHFYAKDLDKIRNKWTKKTTI